MPLYEYECMLCHFRFERRQGFDHEPMSICPRCQGKARRVIHSVPIFYKGSGFYTTDHGTRVHSQASEGKEEQPAKEAEEEG